MPTGWLADRTRPIVLVAGGLVVTAIAVALLTLPPATPLLVVAGILSGGGAGLVMTPILVELSRRSSRPRIAGSTIARWPRRELAAKSQLSGVV